MENQKKEIHEYILCQIPELDEQKPITEQLNSLQLVRLAAQIERDYSISILGVEFNAKNFESVETITKLILQKLKADIPN